MRYRELGSPERLSIRQPVQVNALLGLEMSLFDQEHLRVLLINTRNQLMGIHEVYIGSVNQAQVRPAEVFRDAIRQNAPSMILVHNHPSGDPAPSADDVVLTKRLIALGKDLDIDVMDHVIIGDRRFSSLQTIGLIP